MNAIRFSLLLALLSALMLACGGPKEIDMTVEIINPGSPLSPEMKEILPCDVPGPSYLSFDDPWKCRNTGSVAIGATCEATQRQGGAGELVYYYVECDSASGWVISDFISIIQ